MSETLKLPPGHQLIPTEDGSFTLFSEKFQEACHSTAGAKAETILHYIEGCKVLERLSLHQPFVILEVGFGLGIGFLTTLQMLPENAKMIFVSLEIDRKLLEWFAEQHSELHFHWENNLLKASGENFELIVVEGDARIHLPKFLETFSHKFHAVYQDAFSPKRNPALWTKEWFTLLKNASHDEAILSTYSASTSIRKSLHETGWGVHKGAMFGNKKTSTRAYLNKSTDPEILFHLERAPISAPVDLQIPAILQKINT